MWFQETFGYSLLAPWREHIQYWEKEIVGWAVEGWTPDVALPPGAPSPVEDWPLARLEDMLQMSLLYVGIIVFGLCVIKEGRVLIPRSVTDKLKFFYNFTQIVVCSYMAVEALIIKNRAGIPWLPYRPELCSFINAVEPKVANVLWWFYVTKTMDFFDTIFIITGGKTTQFSFLHCYHHLTIFICYWINLRGTYDGGVNQTVWANATVHAIMYTYYLISQHTSPYKVPIPWKKYLTWIQLLQFAYFQVLGVVATWNCPAQNKRCSFMCFWYNCILFGLFMHFYNNTYASKRVKDANGKPTKGKKDIPAPKQKKH